MTNAVTLHVEKHKSSEEISQRQQKRSRREENVSAHAVDILRRPPEQPPAAIKIKTRRKWEAEPLIELSRDEAFPLGLQMRHDHDMKFLKTLDDETRFKIEREIEKDEKAKPASIPLKKYQYKEIETIKNTKSKEIGAQFFELYQILTLKRCFNKAEGNLILDFAQAIIKDIPDLMEIDTEDAPVIVSEEARLFSERLAEKLPISLSEKGAQDLYTQLQKALNEGDAANPGLEDKDGREDQIEVATCQLGFLLFLAQHDLALTAVCIQKNDFKEALNQIADEVETILDSAMQRIEEHGKAHLHVAVQSADEAMFRKMAVEMASAMLLESGSVNFGIIDTIAQKLIPDHFKGTVAEKNLMLVLADLTSNPLVWEKISQAKPPKNRKIPSDPAIRACLGLNNEQAITTRDAQIFVLSAILDHMRQAKAGTCFATAPLLKIMYYHLPIFVQDLVEMTEQGSLSRTLFGDLKEFPFQARVTNEFLRVLLTADKTGRIMESKRYEFSADDAHKWPAPEQDAYVFQSPGIIAACRAMNLPDVQQAVIAAIQELPEVFSVNELLKKLSQIAYLKQESSPYTLRSQERCTEDQFLYKAQFAFGIQTNHPLHRAFEQIATSMVYYLGTQYMIPSLIPTTMRDLLKKAAKGLSLPFQQKYRKLLKELFLPILTRVRFRYNPNIEDSKLLFDDDNYGVREGKFYGYQLYDCGLPKDFVYSTSLFTNYEQEASHFKYEKFKEHSSPETWKPVETEEKFREFLKDVVIETVKHLKGRTRLSSQKKLWDQVCEKMIKDVSAPHFTEKMIFGLFGKGSDLKKDYLENEHSMMTKPWTFRWGGDFNAVLKTFFGFTKSPSKLQKFNGTQKEVLARSINFLKNQPEIIKDDFENPRNSLLVCAPVHVFLLRPFEESFKKAWESELPTNVYIENHVEQPGLEISKKQLSADQKATLINFTAQNLWASRYEENEDWVRQQLTETSKQILVNKVSEFPQLFEMTVDDFEKSLIDLVALSRASDPNVGKRNAPWEKRCATAIKNLVKKLVPSELRDRKINVNVAQQLLQFAKDRQDTIALVPETAQRFLQLMADAPKKCSMKEFRDFLINSAYQARMEYMNRKDKEWKEKFSKTIDTKLFSVLSSKSQKALISSAIVTHDSNWKDELHDIHCIFMVNPGSGKIELCRFMPDTQEVEFMEQSHWFPRNTQHGSWVFPDNYRVWPHAPLFNVKKMMLGD